MKRLIKWAIIGFFGLASFALSIVIAGFIVPLEIHHVATSQAPYGPRIEERPFVGLALSGGGARAAVFGTAGMEALARRGLLADVTHVSSVSGGGFPASYLATHAMPDCATSDERDNCLAVYFGDMRAAVSVDVFSALTWVQIRNPWRLMQPSRRLSSLSEALDAGFLRGADFVDITDNRAYFFNAVSYDTGQRFVFSNSVLPDPETDGANLLPSSLRALSFSEPGAAQSTPRHFPLSLAVATSAAFPPYLGPLTLQLEPGGDGDLRFRHLGDGGVLENSGVETLTEVFLGGAEPETALIYAFNAGLPLDQDASLANSDLSIFSRNLEQFVDVLLAYASAHRKAHIAEFTAARGLDIRVMSFDYLDVSPLVAASVEGAEQWQSWAGWPQCSARAQRGAASPVARLERVPTDLRISPCDADLVAAAAEFVVQHCLAAPVANGCFSGR